MTMATSAALARKLLDSGSGGLEELRVHVFDDDLAAHDDVAIESLTADFVVEFDRCVVELSQVYGAPQRLGTEDDDAVPLNGVFRFAVWTVGNQELFAAAAHEDRELPILLMLGTAG
ncbi:MAG: hypothetical protein U0804_08080 [Gemmataceae bacterium]